MVNSKRCENINCFRDSGNLITVTLPPATNGLLALDSGLPPLVVAPTERLLEASQQSNVVLQQNALLLRCFVVHSPAGEVLGKDALLEASLQVPVAPLLHLLVHQPHVHRRHKLLSIAVATSYGRLVLSIVAIVLLVTNVSTGNALVLSIHRAEELVGITFR